MLSSKDAVRPRSSQLKKKGSLCLLRAKRQPSKPSRLLTLIHEEPSENNNVSAARHQFKFLYPIGKGGFGKVWVVERKRTKQLLAMKEMSKAKVISKRSVSSVLNERRLLWSLTHP